jgi:hypothetical protein
MLAQFVLLAFLAIEIAILDYVVLLNYLPYEVDKDLDEDKHQ